MTARYEGLIVMSAPVRSGRDVARVRELGRDFREPVVVRSSPTKGEARLLAGLIMLCLVWAALAVVGAVAVGCWLWPHRVGVEQAVFVAAAFGVAGCVCRYVNVKRAGR